MYYLISLLLLGREAHSSNTDLPTSFLMAFYDFKGRVPFLEIVFVLVWCGFMVYTFFNLPTFSLAAKLIRSQYGPSIPLKNATF